MRTQEPIPQNVKTVIAFYPQLTLLNLCVSSSRRPVLTLPLSDPLCSELVELEYLVQGRLDLKTDERGALITWIKILDSKNFGGRHACL